jgi:hypothetical protein
MRSSNTGRSGIGPSSQTTGRQGTTRRTRNRSYGVRRWPVCRCARVRAGKFRVSNHPSKTDVPLNSPLLDVKLEIQIVPATNMSVPRDGPYWRRTLDTYSSCTRSVGYIAARGPGSPAQYVSRLSTRRAESCLGELPVRATSRRAIYPRRSKVLFPTGTTVTDLQSGSNVGMSPRSI